MSLCLAAAGLAVEIATSSFTLAWMHTVEKTEWREDWRVEGNRLRLVEAGVKGSGAGMEPPPEARLEGGFYVWSPDIEREEILLRRDAHAGDWKLCAGVLCAPLRVWLGRDADPVRLYAATGDCEAQ